jgi:hypothetical protein
VSRPSPEEEQAVRDQLATIREGLARARETVDAASEEPAYAFAPAPEPVDA